MFFKLEIIIASDRQLFSVDCGAVRNPKKICVIY